ncbi:MAG: electron transport complex subunit E [Clostridia bacterium]
MKTKFEIFIKGIWRENPIFRLLLGLCPTLAVTTSAENGLGMGVATFAVLLASNTVISSIRKMIPEKVRIPVYITVIAGFVTVVQLLLRAYLPDLDRALGIFIPLIVVNCIILGRAEAFASRNPVGSSILDALGMGIGFTLALVVIGSIREILGTGHVFGMNLTGGAIPPAVIFIMPPGAFLVLGFLLALINKISGNRLRVKDCASCPMKCRLTEEGIE